MYFTERHGAYSRDKTINILHSSWHAGNLIILGILRRARE
jgi:hypothetical protein